MNKLPVGLLSACVELDRSTGNLHWKDRPLWTFNEGKYSIGREAVRWNTRYSGKRAFNTLSPYGYLTGRLNEVSLYSHRVVWALYYGNFPDLWLDHIDGDRTNNLITNLREVTYKENNKNTALRSNNKTGVVGVSLRNKGFEANIKNNQGVQIFLGYYKTVDEAAKVRQEAENKYGYHPNHGRV